MQSLFVPIPMSNEIRRKDHTCATTYSSTIYAVDVKVLQLECHLPAKSFCEALSVAHSSYINITTHTEKNIYRAVVGDCLTEYNYQRSSLNTRRNITESSFATECPIYLKTPPIVSLDANFGLVHKRSSGNGHGRHFARHKTTFFLNQHNVTKFIDDYAVDKKNSYSECSNFQAGSAIRSKIKTNKLDVTGIFGSVCKHDIPLHFLDLSHGERLSYPVYLLHCLLENRTENLVVMYDIACMLHKHLKKMDNKLILEKCTFAVPVFHSFAHNTSCQLTYGQRYAKSTGLTDGEGIERLWSYLRGFRSITKEMSIGNRQDLLTEALLHHTDKQIWNLAHRLEDKKKKCERIMSDTETIVTKILSELNETEESIQVWLSDWMSLCNGNDIKAYFLTADEQYAECLQKIQLEQNHLNTVETVEEKGLIKAVIEKLSQECKKLKNKAVCKNITIDSQQGQILVNSAKKKRQKTSLLKLKELATDRQYLSSLMKKYAEGQAIGIRISKQFTQNFNKIKKEVDIYNTIMNTDINVRDFMAPNMTIYEQLNVTTNLSEKQQQAVQSKSLHDHAKEEYACIKNEVKLFCHQLAVQSNDILRHINQISSLEKTRINFGKIQYLYHKHFNIESLFNACEQHFESSTDTVVPNIVHEMLQSKATSMQMSSNLDLEMPSEEEIQNIVAEIEEFELVESINAEAGDEEEDDCDEEDFSEL